jgi:hypothetical protein
MTDNRHLPAVIQRWLQREHVKPRELVRRMGYRNEAKGLRRLQSWLRGEALPTGDQPHRLGRALGLSDQELEQLLQHDASAMLNEARRRRGKDPRYYLTTRYFAGFYATAALEPWLDLEQALQQARDNSREKHLRCCLDTPENRQYWIGKDGEIEHVTEGRQPVMCVGGQRFRVVME